MKERPILFSTEMVQAILREENPKTQTRRIVKPQPITHDHKPFEMAQWNDEPEKWEIYDDNTLRCSVCGLGTHHFTGEGYIKNPYGQVGDILWVRETWCKHKGEYLYKAEGIDVNEFRWKPSIHMPKEACRIKLRVSSVRIERLLDISEQDAIAEGLKLVEIAGQKEYGVAGKYFLNPKDTYFYLWDKINGNYAHRQNPYVWVIEFERVS